MNERDLQKEAEYIGGDIKALLRVLGILIRNGKLTKTFKQRVTRLDLALWKKHSLKNELEAGNEEATQFCTQEVSDNSDMVN